MTNRRLAAALRCLLLLSAVCTTLAAAPAKTDESGMHPAHLQAVADLVEHVQPADSSYQHQHGVVHWQGSGDATRYECHTDCSGLLNHLLEHCYAIRGKDLKGWLGKQRPTTETYYEAIVAKNGFGHIVQLADVRPGDIIAVKYPPGSGNTGHILIVTLVPTRRAASAPVVADTEKWDVRIIDSTASGHGQGDTRLRPDGTFRDGIGAGVMRIYTDPQGTVMGHTWSRARASSYRSQRERHLVIGRLTSDKTAHHEPTN